MAYAPWRAGQRITADQLNAYTYAVQAWSTSIREYGAQGDGVTNDASSFQIALDDIAARGGGWLVVTPGTYLIASLPLRIYRNTRITLTPGAAMVRGTTGTFLINGTASQNFGGYTGEGNIIIEGGVWDMQADVFGSSAMCMSIGHARGITIRDLEIRDVAGFHAIELNSTKQALIENCQFRGYVDPGGRDFSEAVQIDGAFRSTVFGGFGPYDHTTCEDITIRDCYVGPSGTAGTVAWPSGVGSHSATWGTSHRRIRVESCTFEGGAQYAIKPYIWDDFVISGNTISGCGAGIWARTLDSSKVADRTDANGVDQNSSQFQRCAVISGNTIRNTGSFDDGIFIQGESTGKWLDVSITGNSIVSVGGSQNGIRAERLERSVISDNALDAIGGSGISTASNQYVTISGNRITSCGGSWITNDAGSYLSIIANQASDCQTHGIWSFGGGNIKISENFLRGAGRGNAADQAIRLSTSGSDRITVTNNSYRQWGSGTESSSVFTATSAVTNLRRFGNDWLGQGTVNDSSTTPNLSPYDAGTP